ncbi:MAG: MBOAT family O-acyltransferase [Alphaproteobacteria bacterium]
MVFSSLIFLFLFLPVFLGLYYLTPYKFRSITILIGSYFFYAWWRVDFLLLLVAVTYWNYIISKLILKNDGNQIGRRWMQLGVVGNLICLGFFKYFNFGVDSLNALLNESGMQTIEALRFILPIGISFYIFQSISYLIDVYRKDAPPPSKFTDFAAFISLFPQLIAGPVLRYKDLADQFTQRTHSFEKFSQGAYRFMCGFVQKVLIADSVADLVDKSFALEDPSMADAWLGALAYTVQLYFDFCGYSNMAIGLGLMMGFKFIENFNHPYISRSITEFWRRWHISLSAWLRDYLYIPLGGNRKGVVRTYINLFLTMLLGGLWHGANWTFILWGAWHGGILAIERGLGARQKEKGTIEQKPSIAWNGAKMLFTFFLVVLGWVMFRAENVSQAFDYYGAMFGANANTGISDGLHWQITGVSMTALAIGLIWSFAAPAFEKYAGTQFKHTRKWYIHGVMIALFLLAVIKLGAQNYSPFLYFQF